MPKTESVTPQPAAAAPVVPMPSKPVQPASESVPVEIKPAVYVAQQTNEFIEYLLKTYRPRLSTTAYSPELGIMGTIQFYDNFEVVESYTVLRKPYGVDLVFAGKSFIVSSWKLPHNPHLFQCLKPTHSLRQLKQSFLISFIFYNNLL